MCSCSAPSSSRRPAENFPQVARGNIEAAVAVNFQWGTTIPEMSATLIPYYMTDLAQIRKFPTSEARRFLDQKLEARGVHSIAWLYITRESIFTSSKKPLITLDDFKGVKIRGLNSLTDNALTAVGAAPSAMPGSEVYQALQSGVLDAGLTDLSAAYSRKYYEIQKFGTVAPYFTIFFHVYVNPQWWAKLAPAQRQAIEAAAAKAEQEAFTVTEATAADALVQLKDKGMTIHVQTPRGTGDMEGGDAKAGARRLPQVRAAGRPEDPRTAEGALAGRDVSARATRARRCARRARASPRRRCSRRSPRSRIRSCAATCSVRRSRGPTSSSGYLLVASVMLAAADALFGGEHIAVDIVTERLAPRGKRIAFLFGLARRRSDRGAAARRGRRHRAVLASGRPALERGSRGSDVDTATRWCRSAHCLLLLAAIVSFVLAWRGQSAAAGARDAGARHRVSVRAARSRAARRR